MFYLAQGISAIALILAVISMQCKKKILIMAFQVPSNVLYAVSSFLLGATAGGIVILFAAVRCFTIVLFEKEHKPYPIWLYFLFQFFVIVSAGVVWAGPITLLSLFSGIIYNQAFCLEKGNRLKLITMLAAGLSSTYNILYGGYINAMIDLITLLSAGAYLLIWIIKRKKLDYLM